jgi:hypothetical protein
MMPFTLHHVELLRAARRSLAANRRCKVDGDALPISSTTRTASW